MINIVKNVRNSVKHKFRVKDFKYVHADDLTDDYLHDMFKDAPVLKKSHGKEKYSFFNIAVAFDIETSIFKYTKKEDEYVLDDKYLNSTTDQFKYTPFSFMYHWQFGTNKHVIYGRQWEEFICAMKKIKDYLELSLKKRLIIYVHNLAYEFQFIYRFFKFEKVMARAPHKIMKAVTEDGFEFRCSYFLSNMSLYKFCENSKLCYHYKLKGKFDYDKVRYFDIPLTRIEFLYCMYDVIGLCECIMTLMLEDDLGSIPLTNTGYVRRFCRDKCKENLNIWSSIKKSALTVEEYTLCKKVFRGGNTHANRIYANRVITNVRSFDITSAYPYAMLTQKFPIGKGKEVIVESNEDLFNYIESGYLAIMEIELFDVNLRADVPMPYIDLAHCKSKSNVVDDNGRVLKADYLLYYCNSVDLQIVFDEYDSNLKWKMKVCYIYQADYLPLELRESIYMFFKEKTNYKHVDDYLYMKSKNRLNSCYGMAVTAIDQNEILFDDETGEWYEDNVNVEKVLERYYNSKNTFLNYIWGVFVPTFTRRMLEDALQEIGNDAVYIDTDCVKYIGEHDEVFEKLNKQIRSSVLSMDLQPIAYDKDGNEEMVGIWDDEGIYPEFKTLGAKKYITTNRKKLYVDSKHKKVPYIITVSGINKEKGSQLIKDLKEFSIGKEYHNVGRTCAFYNNNDLMYIEADGRTFLITPNVGIVDTTYTLGVTDSYAKRIVDNLDIDDIRYLGVKYKKTWGKYNEDRE